MINKRSQFTLVCACLFGLSTFAVPGGENPSPATAGKSSGVYFTENKGQVHDQNNLLRPDVLFSGSAGQMTFHLRQKGISYQLSRTEAGNKPLAQGPGFSPGEASPTTIYRVDINWVNASSKAQVKTENARPGVEHYCQSAPLTEVKGVRSFGLVTYENLYPGISLTWYEKEGNLKYDYLVAAGADYSQVQLLVEGAESLRINQSGEVEIKTPLGTITEHAPLVTQNGKVLPSRWVLRGHVLSFAIDGVDPAQPIVIDPAVYAWITYYGGSNGEDTHACKTDNAGNVYFAGETRSTTAIATSGSYQTTLSSATDAFLAKFTSAGVRLWATYYGAGSNENAYGCDVDASNNVYMAGRNQSGAVLFKFNANGLYQWHVSLGSSSYDFGRACATDAGGNVYLSGETTATSGIATSGSHQTVFGGGTNSDAFLAKYDGSGNLLWSTYYGGNNEDFGYGCDTDPSGNVYLAGATRSASGISTSGSHQAAMGASSGGAKDAFLVKFNSNGVRQWGTYYGSTGDDYGYACATDLYGNIFLAGATSSSNMSTPGSYQASHGGLVDAYLVKFTTSGSRVWATYVGGTDYDEGFACTTDGSGNAYLAGRYIASGSNPQAFVYKFLSSGLYQWGYIFGLSPGDEHYKAVAADATGAVYAAGMTNNGLPALSTTGSHQPAYGGGYDAVFVKMQDCNAVSTTPLSNLTVCNGTGAVLSAASSTNAITWYATSTSTAVLGTGSTYTTPALSTGTYTYYASSDACLPNQRTAITVTAQNAPTVTASGGNICSGQSFTIVPSGAVSYSYSSGSAIVSPATTTIYTVTGSNSAGCTGTGTVQVTVNALPVISVTSPTVCSGATATLTASGASTYTWNTGANGASLVVTPASTTNYTVTGTSSSGCVNTATATVTVDVAPVMSVNAATVCAGTSATLTASGVSTYTWNTGATGSSLSVNPASTTTYTVSGNLAGCATTVVGTTTVTVLALPVLTVSAGTSSICAGQSATLSVTGTAASYTWSTGQTASAITVSPGTTTSYSITGIHANGCSNMAFTTLTVNPNPVVSVPPATVCLGGTVTLNASGANTYTWSTGAIGASLNVSPTAITNYTVTGVSATGCTNQATVVVSVGTGPSVAVNNATICAGTNAILTASGAATYTWSTGQQMPGISVAPLSTTVYTVTGGVPGCNFYAVQTATVTVNGTPTVSVISTKTLICTGETATLTAFGANTYNWSTTQTGSVVIVAPTATSSYTVSGISPLGCQDEAVISVSVSPCTGILENAFQNINIVLYPNPFTGVFTIRYAQQENDDVTVMNALGAVVYRTRLTGENTEIALPYEAGGIYFVQIKTRYGVVTQKMVKE